MKGSGGVYCGESWSGAMEDHDNAPEWLRLLGYEYLLSEWDYGVLRWKDPDEVRRMLERQRKMVQSEMMSEFNDD